jgi:hypothetical protein
LLAVHETRFGGFFIAWVSHFFAGKKRPGKSRVKNRD